MVWYVRNVWMWVDCSSWIECKRQLIGDCLKEKEQIFHLALENQLDVDCSERTKGQKKRKTIFAVANVCHCAHHNKIKYNCFIGNRRLYCYVYLLSCLFFYFFLCFSNQSPITFDWIFSFASSCVRSATIWYQFMRAHRSCVYIRWIRYIRMRV